MSKAFKIVFAVPMECDSCVNSVSNALKSVDGVSSYDIDLKSNIVTTEGCVAPSEIVKAIQSLGKDAIIRGTGAPDSAAVCILESFDDKDRAQPVKGLARIVSVGQNDLFIDLSVDGLPRGMYYPSIRQSGNLSQGALSTGASFYRLQPLAVEQPSSISTMIHSLGATTRESSSTSLFAGKDFLHADLNINELIGKSIILSRLQDEVTTDSLCGVIARSAGAWENTKEVCSCSGKTVWQERSDAVSKGLKM